MPSAHNSCNLCDRPLLLLGSSISTILCPVCSICLYPSQSPLAILTSTLSLFFLCLRSTVPKFTNLHQHLKCVMHVHICKTYSCPGFVALLLWLCHSHGHSNITGPGPQRTACSEISFTHHILKYLTVRWLILIYPLIFSYLFWP